MDSRLVSEVLDLPCSLCGSYAGDLTSLLKEPRARHALVFREAWRSAFGSSPSKLEFHEYFSACDERSETLNRSRFVSYASGERLLPCVSTPNVRAFERSISSDVETRVLDKISERFEVDPEDGESIDAFVARCSSTVAYDTELDDCSNGLTGNDLIESRASHGMRGSLTRFEVIASAWSRDPHFAQTAARSALVSASRGVCIETVREIARSVASMFAVPIYVSYEGDTDANGSDDDHDEEDDDLYCYGLRLPSRSRLRQALPRLFALHFHVGHEDDPGPMLSRTRCVFYRVTDWKRGGASARPKPFPRDAPFTPVSDRPFEDEDVYFLPRFAPEPTVAGNKERVAVGRHPHSGSPSLSVSPRDAGSCDVYVNDSNLEGVLACMAGGGTPVVSEAVIAMSDGILVEGVTCALTVAEAVEMNRRGDGRSVACLAYRLMRDRTVFRWMLGLILKNPCPIRSNDPKGTTVLFGRFLLLLANRRLRSGRLPVGCVPEEGENTVVAVDTREDPATLLSLFLTLSNLDLGRWKVRVFCCGSNVGYFRSVLPGACVVTLPELKPRAFFIEQYNRLLKSPAFWRRVPGKRCLIVQNDGLLARRGLEDHACFSGEYAYVGAPWKPNRYLEEATGGNMVGNGGFSLRDPRECEAVCERAQVENMSRRQYPLCPLMTEAEDVFFARNLASTTSGVCPSSVAATFSIEQIPNKFSLGFHRFWVYQPVQVTREVFRDFLGSD